jgi:hypothetical protein
MQEERLREHRAEWLAVDVKKEVAVGETSRPGALDDRAFLVAKHDFAGSPFVLRLLLRPPELPRVSEDQHVPLARALEPPLADGR